MFGKGGQVPEPGSEPNPFGLNPPNIAPSINPGGPAVQSAPTPGGPVTLNQDVMNAMSAQRAGGSIMDRQKPDWYKNLPNKLGPTAGTAAQTGLNLLDTALGGISPLDAAGGGSKAILGPIVGKAEKKVVSSLAKNAPELMDQLKRMPNKVDFKVGTPWVNPQASGIMEGGNMVPYSRITIAPEVLRGRLPTAVQQAYPDFANTTGKADIFANLPAVVGHEGQHAVDAANKNFQGMQAPGHAKLALDTTRAMERAPAGPAQQGLEQIKQALASNTKEGADEAIAYLRQHQIAGTRALMPMANDILGAEKKLTPYTYELSPANILARQIMKKRMK